MKTVVRSFETTRDMAMWLSDPLSIAGLKAKYPPPRYGAEVDLHAMKVVVTDNEAKSDG